MTQYVINIGSVPNDGTGDPLRTAFNETNLNFNQIFAAGPVLSNIQIANNSILTTNTNGNLVLNPNGIGVVQANAHVVPDQTRIRNLGSSTLLWNTTYTQYLNTTFANIGTATIGNIGNITIDVGNLHISGGTNGYVLQTDGTGNLTWTAQTGGSGNGTPGGANTQIQYNNAGAFGGSAGFTYDSGNGVLTTQNIVVDNLTTNNTIETVDINVGGNINTSTIIGDSNVGQVIIIANSAVSSDYWEFRTHPSGAPDGSITSALHVPPSDGANISAIHFPGYYGGGYLGWYNLNSWANSLTLISTNTVSITTEAQGGIPGETQWLFDTAGNLTLPALTGAVQSIALTDGGVGYTTANNVPTDSGAYGNGHGMTLNIVADTSNSNAVLSATISNPGQGYANGAVITIAQPSSTGTATVTVTTIANGSPSINYANGVSILDGVAGNYGDSNVVTLMADFGSNVISTTGNVSAGNVLTSAMVIANGEIQSGTGFFTGGYLSVNGNTDLANANITGSLSAVGNVTAAGFTTTGATGNITGANYITANYFVGDGGLLSNVGALIQSNTAPMDPTSSTMWWDTTDGSLYVWYTDNAGSQWVAASPTGVDWANVTSDIIPSANNAFSLGNATNQWASVYVGANTLYLNNVPVGITGNTLTVAGANVVTAQPGGVVSTTGNIVGGDFYYGNGTPVAGSGPQGATGPAGTNGATGPQGATGANGTNGATGLTGATGANGTNGATGSTGPSGSNGSTGATGPAGTNGATGATGSFSGNLSANINGYGYNISNVATISTTGNISTSGKFVGDGSALTNINYSSVGNIVGPQSNVTLVAGSYSYVFDNSGNVTLPAGGDLVFSANTSLTSISNGNITIDPNGTGQLIVTATTPAQFGNTISATGNITTSGKFIGDGSSLTNVATKSSGSWTLATGTNTVNFTVTAGRTYSMWVNGNIPNGIVVWNATATLTNTNVPVIGQQFGWYYSAGNALVLTSMPSQIIGTAGSISTSSPAVANTNVFNFTIVNNSGSSQTVYYGWTQIS